MQLTVTIQGDDRLFAITDKLDDLIKNPKKPLKASGDLLVDEYQKNFPAEGSRLGRRWADLATSTLIQKARMGYGSKGILERTGTLKRGFDQELRRMYVRVFNPVGYYKFHQLGGGSLPQRKMISAPEKLKQQIIAIFSDEVRARLNNKIL